ncbi:MAG: peptide chain release factor N(5)-glutamine methyltransferase [Endomicrobiaceae bacterium]|nr:peptide chain release factor N(5)-glutamine methyltransferase [Endomicrobiaceae bacterium]
MYQSEKNIFTILKQATEFLTSHNITEAQIDAEVLLCGVLKIKRNILVTLRQETLTQEQYQQYQNYLTRRTTGEPVDYILGFSEFMGLNFKVNSDVLIPRPETELIVEQANKFIKENNYKQVLDLCTGSGAIAVAVAYYNDISVVASDISKKALQVAKENASQNNVSNKIEFIESSMFDNIINKKFDIIISNPPYVTEDEYKNLQKEIFFEPKNAFVAGKDGLEFYKIIAGKAKQYLNSKGILLLELNSNISLQIADLFDDFLFIKIIKDYSGLDRILIAQNG